MTRGERAEYRAGDDPRDESDHDREGEDDRDPPRTAAVCVTENSIEAIR